MEGILPANPAYMPVTGIHPQYTVILIAFSCKYLY